MGESEKYNIFNIRKIEYFFITLNRDAKQIYQSTVLKSGAVGSNINIHVLKKIIQYKEQVNI